MQTSRLKSGQERGLPKFVAFYFGRHGQFETVSGEDELRAMRRTHQSRAKEWWASSEHRLDIHPTWRSDSAQHTYSNEALLSRLAKYFSLDPEQVERFENSKPLSLLDVLPFFMEVSADIQCIENKNDANITHEWMTLAAELILQSVLEQWLVYGAVGPDTLSEAFAWGYRKGGANKSCWRAEEMVNDMFREGGSEAEVDGWSAIKEKAMSMVSLFTACSILLPLTDFTQLRAPANTALSRQLEDVSKRLPAPALDETVFNFVDAVHQSREKPIMLQLEHGDVQGLSHSEVDRLKARVRWPPENGLGPVFRFSEG